MKPLNLLISGFKSFEEMQEIDFESLTSDGLFGVCGATGSGKSSVLAALIFALYGSSEKNAGERLMNLRQDKTRVRLKFEIEREEKRKIYLVERNMARAKDGVVKEKTASLFEVGDGLIPLCEKSDTAVTNKITEIIGLDRKDFLQCVVLEQGEFDKFIKLKARDRNEVLERIFGFEKYGEPLTGRVTKGRSEAAAASQMIESALLEYAKATKEECKKAEAALKALRIEKEGALIERERAAATLADAKEHFLAGQRHKKLTEQKNELELSLNALKMITIKRRQAYSKCRRRQRQVTKGKANS